MSEKDDRLDFSALDPQEDPKRWDAIVAETMRRVDEVVSHRAGDPFAAIAGWRRPLLVAAAVVMAILVQVEIALEQRDDALERVQRLVSLSEGWEQGESPPAGDEFLRALRPQVQR